MKVLEALAAAIAAEGIDRIFAVIGDANQEIIVELCEKHGLKFVHTHHETAAVGMADGYARLSGKIGLASTTQGPGYTNATTSLVSARLHRSPVLMQAGHASLRDPYNPQGMLDQHAMAKLTTGATVKIDHGHNVDYCLASFMMNVSDFHTAVSHNLPLTVFVFNDNAVGQERHDLIHKGLPPKYAEVASPDFEKLAVGFGAKGFRVNRPDDFGEIDKALAVEDGPVIVNVRINGDVELPVSWEIAQALEMTG